MSPSYPRPIRLTPQQIEEKRAKGLCFNCDRKYGPNHKCYEKKLFYIEGSSDEEEYEATLIEEVEKLEEESVDPQPTISCHALSSISTPQTVQVVGVIKN